MSLVVFDPDNAAKLSLYREFRALMPDAVLINAAMGSSIFERTLGFFPHRIIVAYGLEPHSIGDFRFLGTFGKCPNYAGYIHPPEGIVAALAAGTERREKIIEEVVDTYRRRAASLAALKSAPPRQ